MIASYNFLSLLMLPAFMGMATLATPVLNRDISPAVHQVRDMSSRSANTCADPSLSVTIYSAYDSVSTAHLLAEHYVFVSATSVQPSTVPVYWTFQGPVFNGFQTQQQFTVPLFRLTSPNSLDFTFMVGADAQTPPVVTGYTAGPIAAWVYNTPVCGSVPLMSAVLHQHPDGDHYWTTDPKEQAGLLSQGWADSGIVAYVLPSQ